jgi:hypothetical protein
VGAFKAAAHFALLRVLCSCLGHVEIGDALETGPQPTSTDDGDGDDGDGDQCSIQKVSPTLWHRL